MLVWKPKGPWIIVTAILGCIYGAITYYMCGGVECDVEDPLKPFLLKDKYPSMYDITQVELWSFEYLNANIALSAIIVGSLKVAFVAVLETLISARIADNMKSDEPRHNASDETRGLAFANMLSGMLGNMPCTGVLIRTSVNASSGATDKCAQFINAIWVLAMVLVLLPPFSFIPMSVIASILITSSCRLIPKYFIRQTFIADKFECLLIIITWLACIMIDGAVGLLIGCFIALAREGCDLGGLKCSQDVDDKNTLMILVSGKLNFLTNIEFEDYVKNAMKEDPEAAAILCFTDIEVIDFDALASIKLMAKKFPGLKIQLDSASLENRVQALTQQVESTKTFDYELLQ